VELDPYVFHTLMRDLVFHDRHPSAMLVYLQLAYLASRDPGGVVRISHETLAFETGLSKSAVQGAVRRLRRRRLLRSTRESAVAVPRYEVLRPWGRP
jgi:hypothetical protein